MREELSLKTLLHIGQAIENYKDLYLNFTGRVGSYKEEVDNYMKKFRSPEGYLLAQGDTLWGDVNINHVKQMWSNTSGGWQGVGGCVMTECYTTVIECRPGNAAFIYYKGELAYVVEMNDEYNLYRKDGLRHLPGVQSLKDSKLKIIYRWEYKSSI